MKLSTASMAFAAAMLGLVVTASAQTSAPYYAGKQIRMVIASGAGGGYDVYARVLSQTLTKYIPGNPILVNENMPGASGLNATNWTFAQAPKDGTIILATYNALLLEPLLGNKKAAYDPTKLQWVGSIGRQQQICMSWHTSPIKTIEDAKMREMTVSATGATGNAATMPKLVNALLGTKFKVIGGYSTSESRLAVERGEVEGICGLSWTTLEASNPDWIQNKRMNVLLQTGALRQAELPRVPLLRELVANPGDVEVLDLLQLPEDIGRPFAMPPGTPDTLVAIIRTAFDAVIKDKDFLAAGAKAHLEVAPMSGAEMQRRIAAAYAAPKPLVERTKELIGRTGKSIASPKPGQGKPAHQG
jgi:tripartite-type tricarboxylate transporter receptor subunit TctC